MQDADATTVHMAEPSRSSRSPVSVALLAAIACMPIVIAAGFLADRSSGVVALPGDISVLSLRGGLDGAAAVRPSSPTRAGY